MSNKIRLTTATATSSVSNAKIPDVQTLIQAGIDPKTRLPLKAVSDNDGWRKEAVKLALRIMDEQDAVNRYRWYNLPGGLSSQELERMLYFKGQLCMFYYEPLDEFYFMPYALDGTIDFYGRYNRIHPVPLSGGTTDADKAQEDLLSRIKLNVMYDVPDVVDYDVAVNSCVLLHDYTKQLSQTIIPRKDVNDRLLDIMADCIPFMRTALLSGTGVLGMRVNNQDEESNVKAASRTVDRAALNGEKWVALIGAIDFQELTGGSVMKAQEYLAAMQGLDNFRLSLYGLDQGGLFQKSSHMLQAEQAMNTGNAGLIIDDGLAIRQRFCDIANCLWGVGISCEVAETVMNADMNGDGQAVTDYDQSGSFEGDQMDMAGGGTDE